MVCALELVFGRGVYAVARFGGDGLGLAKRLLDLVVAATAFDSYHAAAHPSRPTGAAPHPAAAVVAVAFRRKQLQSAAEATSPSA